jgi:hypothetical protein
MRFKSSPLAGDRTAPLPSYLLLLDAEMTWPPARWCTCVPIIKRRII